MIVLELDEQVSVSVETGLEKLYAYTVYEYDEEVVRYETSADIRKPAGRVGVRNVIFQQISGCEKEEIENQLQEQLNRRRAAINETFGSA